MSFEASILPTVALGAILPTANELDIAALPVTFKVLPSNRKLASPLMVAPPVAVKI